MTIKKMRILPDPLIDLQFHGLVYEFDISVIERMSAVDGVRYPCYRATQNRGWWFVHALEEVHENNEWGVVSP